MVLYYAMTNYHILNCILHKLKYNKNKKAVLYLSEWHSEHSKLIRQIKETGFFDKVLVFHEVLFPKTTTELSKEKIKENIKKISNQIENNLHNKLSKFDEINICGDHYGFSVYINYKNIKYNYFEDGAGILSKKNILMNNIKKIDYSRYQILNYMNLPGESKNVIHRFGDLQSQLNNYQNKKDIDFSVKAELKKINKKDIEKIIHIFLENNQKIECFDNYNILLTFHYNNLGIFDMEEQRQFYNFLIDYYNNDYNIVIKPHPSDVQPNYKEWFPNFKVMPRNLPSELLPFFLKNKFHYAITGWSTSVNGLKDILDDTIKFEQDIDFKYMKFNQYYCIYQVIKNIFSEYNIILINLNKEYINNFSKSDNKYFNIDKKSLNDLKKEQNNDRKKLIIIDENTESPNNLLNIMNRLGENDAIIYTDSDNTDIDSIQNKDIISIEIKKKIINKENYYYQNILDFECIHFITKSNKIKDEIIKFNTKKVLPLSNIQIELNNDKEIMINDYQLFLNNQIKKLQNENKNLKSVVLEKEKKINEQMINYKDLLNNNKMLNNDYNKINQENQCLKKEQSNDKLIIQELQNEIKSILNSNSWKMTKWYRTIGKKIKKIIYKN